MEPPRFPARFNLVVACGSVGDSFNNRIHAVTRAVPAEQLAIEGKFLHSIPDSPYTVAFGESRSVGWSSTISFRSARYSVPDELAGGEAWVRVHGNEVVIVVGTGSGAHEVARHDLQGPGGASIVDAHYRHRPPDPLHRRPKAKSASGAAFLALGEGASLYLVEAGAAGARAIPKRMAEAVTLSSLHSPDAVDRALGIAAMAGRFDDGDIASILTHASGSVVTAAFPPPEHSLAAGTGMWSQLSGPTASTTTPADDGEEEADK